MFGLFCMFSNPFLKIEVLGSPETQHHIPEDGNQNQMNCISGTKIQARISIEKIDMFMSCYLCRARGANTRVTFLYTLFLNTSE
jgi:hypothetical protein